jgi:hypothetical protein
LHCLSPDANDGHRLLLVAPDPRIKFTIFLSSSPGGT